MIATRTIVAAFPLFFLSACLYSPLSEDHMRVEQPAAVKRGEIKVRYLGNTTLHITDGSTDLLIDGFLTRSGLGPSFFGRIEPCEKIICNALEEAGIEKIDAVVVGHTHADHAPDAPYISKRWNAQVIGTTAYRFIHAGYGAPMKNLKTVSGKRGSFPVGKFTVTLVLSDHVPATTSYQERIEGDIEAPIHFPAKFTEFKCGPTYAIHIGHEYGNIALTTSAGVECGQWDGLKADTVFLGIGLLSKVRRECQRFYFQETILPLEPKTVVPVHWDVFYFQPKSESSKRRLVTTPWPIDNVAKSMRRLQEDVSNVTYRVLDYNEEIIVRRE